MTIPTPNWQTRAEFNAWWLKNYDSVNRSSVIDRQEYERICRAIEAFNLRCPA